MTKTVVRKQVQKKEIKIVEGEREKLPYLRIFVAFVIASVAFSGIFLVSYSISYLNYKGVKSENSIVEQYLEDLDYYLENSDCSETGLYEASEKLDIIGRRLTLLEKRFGKKDRRVLEQKKLYLELELKHFEIVNNLKKQCGEDFLTILFFYSNREVDDEDKRSSTMGFILGTFKREEPSKVMIYSFDYFLDSEVVDYLKINYNVKTTPIVVINEKEQVYVRNIRDLQKYL